MLEVEKATGVLTHGLAGKYEIFGTVGKGNKLIGTITESA